LPAVRKIRIIAVGKDKDGWLAEGAVHYCKLLNRYASIEIEIVSKRRASTSSDPEATKKAEADALLSRLGEADFLALDDRGDTVTSAQFARLLDKLTSHQRGALTIVIGGAYGLDKRVPTAARQCISLSPLTFSHQIVRLVLLEQLYRAFTILEGADYHK
jgi:23S rRNA (pseudouridine1915-N3)-methyltransferase